MSAVMRGVRSAFSSLEVRNFRLFFMSQVVSITGTWMQMIAQAWLVLSMTGSAAALGVVTACQFLPMLVIGPYAGVVADRLDKRRLLMITQSASMVVAFVLGILTASGQMGPLHERACVVGGLDFLGSGAGADFACAGWPTSSE